MSCPDLWVFQIHMTSFSTLKEEDCLFPEEWSKKKHVHPWHMFSGLFSGAVHQNEKWVDMLGIRTIQCVRVRIARDPSVYFTGRDFIWHWGLRGQTWLTPGIPSEITHPRGLLCKLNQRHSTNNNCGFWNKLWRRATQTDWFLLHMHIVPNLQLAWPFDEVCLVLEQEKAFVIFRSQSRGQEKKEKEVNGSLWDNFTALTIRPVLFQAHSTPHIPQSRNWGGKKEEAKS